MVEVECMAGLRRKWKRRLAGFLAACMITTSLQGTAMITAAGYEADANVVVSLSMLNMKEAVSEAVTQNFRYDGELEFFEGKGSGNASEYQEILSASNVYELGSIPYSNTIPMNMPDDTELRIFVCADETQLSEMGKAASDSELKASDSELGAEKYEVKGTEKLYFLFTNRSDRNITFQLKVDGVLSKKIDVPSGETLGYEAASDSEAEEILEEEMEEDVIEAETPSPEDSVIGGGSVDQGAADESQGSDETTDESKNDENVTDDTGAEDETAGESGTDDTKSEEVTDTEGKTDGGTTGTEGEDITNGSSTEEGRAEDNKADKEEADGSVTEGDKTEKEDSTGTEDGKQNDDDKKTDDNKSDEGSKGESSKENTEKEDRAETEKEDKSNKEEKSEKAEKNEDKETDVVVLSKSSKEVPRVTAFVPKDSYDLDDPDAPKSPEEEFDMMGLDDDDDDEEYYTSDYNTFSAENEEAVVSTTGNVLKPVFVQEKTEKKAFFRSRSMDVNETGGEVAVLYTDTVSGLSRTTGENKFQVSLYDYSGTNQNEDAINNYLSGKGKLRFSQGTSGVIGNAYYTPGTNKNACLNVVQGLLPKTYSGDTFSGSFFNEAELFPSGQNGINEKAVKVYDGVQLSGDFFDIDEDGYYSYQSSEQGAQLTEEKDRQGTTIYKLSPEAGEKKFWPFPQNGNNYFFGMKMQFNFYMPEDGKNNNKDMVFEFSGDDDLFIYLNKGESKKHNLVLDLGGNHGRMDGSINFATGEIVYSNKEAKVKTDKQNTPEKNHPVVSYILKDNRQESVAGKNEKVDNYYIAYASLFTKDITIEKYMQRYNVDKSEATQAVEKKYIDFMDFDGEYGQTYQLSLYYMERGGTDSNCHMRFNMPVIPSSGLSLRKQVSGKEDKIPAGETYNFKIHTSDNKEELQKVYDGAESDSVTTNSIGLTAGQTFDLSLADKTWFFIEETSNAGASTSWSLAGGETAAGDGTKTKIYQADKDKTGFLVTFNNSFGELAPQVNKSAWRDESEAERDEYDIALQVTGDSMTTISGEDSGANVLFIYDTSGSMKWNMSGDKQYNVPEDQQRWTQLKTAIDTCLDALSSKENIKVAMFDFNGSAGDLIDIDGATGNSWIPLSSDTVDDVKTAYKRKTIGGSTYPQYAFNKAEDVLKGVEGNTYLVFVADGDPGQSTYEQSVAIRAVTAAQSLKKNCENLTIYTVGVGSSIKHEWWMNPNKPEGNLSSSYATAYYEASDSNKLKKAFDDISQQIIEHTTNVTNLAVTDTLSPEVAPVNIGSGSSDIPMTMWLYDGALGIDEPVTSAIKEASSELTGVKNGDVISYSKDGQEVAKYYLEATGSIPANTIVWTVASELPSETTKTLIYRIKVTGEYREDEFSKPDNNTGTHSLTDPKETGYYSNVKAVLTYNDSETMKFPHPVVRPSAPNGSIVITKDVNDAGSVYDAQGFSFTVELAKVTVDKVFVQGSDDGEPVQKDISNDTLTLSFTLKDGESYSITGLNKDAEYIITEGEYSDDRYFSELNSITVLKNGEADAAGVDKGKRQAKGSLADNGGKRTKYSYKESESVKNNGTIDYGSSVDSDGDGDNGWYDGSEFIPQNDERYFKTIGGTVNGQTAPGTTSYTWKYNGQEVSAAQGNSSKIEEAQAKVERWLKMAGYTVDIASDPSEPYAVSASKQVGNKITKVLEGTRDWFTSEDAIQWNGSETPNSIKNLYLESDYIVTIEKSESGGGLGYKNVIWTYTIYSRETATVTPTLTTTGDSNYWEYGGETYTKAADLISRLQGEGYTVSQDGTSVTYSKKAKRTNKEMFDAGYKHRIYSSETVTVAPSEKALSIEVNYTNTFDKLDSISVSKIVSEDIGVTAPVEAYTFEVQKYNTESENYEKFTDYTVNPETGTNAERSEDGTFAITGNGSVELLIGKESKGATFRVKETNKGTADVMEWNGQTIGRDISGNVENGGEVICTNYYSNNTLTISKILSDDSYAKVPENAKKFVYEVSLKDKDGSPIETVGYDTSTGVTFNAGVLNDSEGMISLSGGIFRFTMEANGSLKLNKIPTGAQYTVNEISMADDKLADYYGYRLVKTELNGTVVENSPALVEGNFSSTDTDAGKNQTVAYTNKLMPVMSSITVKKEIVDKDGNKITDKSADGETFIFKISNEDPSSVGNGENFYVALEIKNGAAEKTLDVPYGVNYVVTEEDHLRYKIFGAEECIVKTISDQNTATIQNYKTGGGYFSDVKVKVNTVDEKGFPQGNSSSRNSAAPVASLPSSSTKNNDDDDKNS